MLGARRSYRAGPKLFEGRGRVGAARLKINREKTFQRELFTGHDSGASDVPLQPARPPAAECVALPPLFFLKNSIPRTSPAVHRRWNLIFIITLRSRLCNLQELLQIPAVAVLFFFFFSLAEAHASRGEGEITFAPRLARTGVAIWQSHQEHFTCLTFTCLHVVNKTSLLSVDEPPRASTGRRRERRRGGAGRTEVEKSES